MKRSEIAITVAYVCYFLTVLLYAVTHDFPYGAAFNTAFFVLVAIYQKISENNDVQS